MIEEVRIPPRTAGVALGCFVLLGLSAGVSGVAWPYIRESFGLPLAALGGLMVPVMISYLLAGAASGHLIGSLGLRRVLAGALAMFVLGLGLTALSPAWWLLPVGWTLAGVGGGALDASVNAFVSTRAAKRLLGFLHGAFSAGGGLGPILVVTVVGVGLGWRGSYAAMAAMAVVLAVVIASVGGWELSSQAAAAAGLESGRSSGWRRRLPPAELMPPLVLSLAAFFVYTGTEISAAQWAYSFLTGGRHAPVAAAAAAVAGFWWGQTLVRAVSGFISIRFGPDILINASLGASLLGAAALWLAPIDGVRFLALVVFGAGLGPLFPTLISLAPSQFGGRALEVVGYQIAAAAVGGALLSGLTGLVLQQWGLLLLPAILFAGVAATLVFHRSSDGLARRSAAGRLEPHAVERVEG